MFRKLLSLIVICILSLPVFSYSICEDQISFTVPQELEIQSEFYKEMKGLFLENTDQKDYDCVLQQKGLNNQDPDSMNHYCRILFRRVIDEDAKYLTNNIYREMFDTFSPEEKEGFFEEIYNFLTSGIVVKEIKDHGTCEIGGKFALYYGLIRESTADKGDVLLYSYMIPCGDTIILMQVAYRVSDEARFSPAIKQFMNSLVINIEEEEYLYEIEIPGTHQTILWPNKEPNWSISASDTSVTTRIAFSNQLIERGYFISISVANFKKPQSLYKSFYTNLLLNQGYQTYMQANMYGKRLNENKVSKDVGSLKYSYKERNLDLYAYGLGKYFFIDDFTLISLEFEYLDVALEEIKMILDSIGIDF